MSPGEHYREAEKLLKWAVDAADQDLFEASHAYATSALAHAQLAAIPVPAGGRW